LHQVEPTKCFECFSTAFGRGRRYTPRATVNVTVLAQLSSASRFHAKKFKIFNAVTINRSLIQRVRSAWTRHSSSDVRSCCFLKTRSEDDDNNVDERSNCTLYCTCRIVVTCVMGVVFHGRKLFVTRLVAGPLE